MSQAIAWYREFVPCKALQADVYAIFSFVPGPFRPGRAAVFLRAAMSDLTDRTVAIDDVSGTNGVRLAEELSELDEAARLSRLESYLLALLSNAPPPTGSIDLPAVTAHILRRRGQVTIESMASDAGVSRQHFTRQFRERLGISPKLYCRPARFHSGLVHAGAQREIDWAETALDLGYADQSHMIAEFRQFSALTPQALVRSHWFHPFIERARRMRWRSPGDGSICDGRS